jgi:hypothetical protein
VEQWGEEECKETTLFKKKKYNGEFNEENGYPVPDPNKTMINVCNELNDAHKKNLSKRKSWKRSLRNS